MNVPGLFLVRIRKETRHPLALPHRERRAVVVDVPVDRVEVVELVDLLDRAIVVLGVTVKAVEIEVPVPTPMVIEARTARRTRDRRQLESRRVGPCATAS